MTEPLRDVITEYEYFWAWIGDKWNLCNRSEFGFFETADGVELDSIDCPDIPSIGIAVPEPPTA